MFMLPRFDRFWNVQKAWQKTLPVLPSIEARKFYCDTLTFDATNLELIAKRVGLDHLMVGSDYPFGVMEDPPGEVLKDVSFDGPALDAIRAGTFRKLAAHVAGTP
jgi:aminocarboxymuconate-semialdehyde decarboxylase